MLPSHILSILLKADSEADRQKVKAALAKLVQEDPTLEVRVDQELGQSIVGGMSELQLEAVAERLKREHMIGVHVSEPRVVFRGSIRRHAEGEGRYIGQTSGSSNYGHVKLRMEPNEVGKGYEFGNESKGGVVPPDYINAINIGIQEAMRSGVLGGCEMVDIKVALYDGSFHDVYSNDMAFRMAGFMAFKEAAGRAMPVRLEPLMSVEVVSPEEYAGAMIDDLQLRRGRVESVEVTGSEHLIRGTAPLAELLGYADRVRDLLRGRASVRVKFKCYQASPDDRDDDGEDELRTAAGPRKPRPGEPRSHIVQREPKRSAR